MQVLNVIEIFEGCLGIKSFGVADEQLLSETVSEAEEMFTKLLEERDVDSDDIDVALENGYYSDNVYSLYLVWSDIDNVQI